MNATECLLEEANLTANARNDEVLRAVLAEIGVSPEKIDCDCTYCWTKLQYCWTKVSAHRIKKRLNQTEYCDEGNRRAFYIWGTKYSNRDVAEVHLSSLRGQAKELRAIMNAAVCICDGKIWNRYGKPIYG